MRTDELRTLLHDRGDEVRDLGAHERVGAVHQRVRVARRRRAAGAAGGLVAAVAAVALAVVPGVTVPRGSQPADGNPPPKTAPGYTKDGVTYRQEVLGERLLGASIGDPGQAEVTFDVTVGRTGLRFSPLCYGVGLDDMVKLSIDGHDISGTTCQEEKDTDPGANGSTFPSGARPLREWGIHPGDVVTVRAWLSRTDMDGDFEVAQHDGAVVGAGIYEDTRAESTVGGVEVPQLLEHDGRTWEMATAYEARPGRSSLWVERDPQKEPALLVAAGSGLRAPGRYTFVLDGEERNAMDLSKGVEGPSWSTVHVFESGEGGEAELKVVRGLTKRTRLSFVEYVPAG